MPAPEPSIVAEQLRLSRRQLIDDIAQGRRRLADLLPPDGAVAAPVKVLILAEAVPGVGKVRSRQILASLAIPNGRRWGELTGEVARTLSEALEAASGETFQSE